ncbi:hypothetical protein DV515_00016394, partial [Chloebia gouldiae]
MAHPWVARPRMAHSRVAHPWVARPRVAHSEVAHSEVAHSEVALPRVALPRVARSRRPRGQQEDTAAAHPTTGRAVETSESRETLEQPCPSRDGEAGACPESPNDPESLPRPPRCSSQASPKMETEQRAPGVVPGSCCDATSRAPAARTSLEKPLLQPGEGNILPEGRPSSTSCGIRCEGEAGSARPTGRHCRLGDSASQVPPV